MKQLSTYNRMKSFQRGEWFWVSISILLVIGIFGLTVTGVGAIIGSL
jgi:ABC-type anion transport system duplicated permease subunit